MRDDENGIHPHLRPLEQLPEEVKKQNRGTAGDIPRLLRAIGLALRPMLQNCSERDC